MLVAGGVALVATVVAGIAGKEPIPRGRAPEERQGIPWALFLFALWFVLWLAAVQVAAAGPCARYGPDLKSWPIPVHLALDGATKFAALAAVFSLRRIRFREADPGTPAPAGRAAAAGLLSGFAVLPFLFGATLLQAWIYKRMGREFAGQDLVREAAGGSLATFGAVALFAVTVAPVFEEFLFRRLIYGGLRARLGAASSALLSAAIFAAWHLEIDAMPATFVLGLGLALLRERTGGLTAPIAMHACYNALQLAGILTARAGG